MKHTHILTMTAAILALTITSPVYAENTDTTTQNLLDSYTDIISDIPYIDDGNENHMLDLYGTSNISENTPVVVEVHGGGFIGGNKTTNKEHSILFANSGFEVVTPDYVKLPDNSFVDAVQDLFAAYQWVADQADTYHFDLNNIFLDGDSAGGYYVLLTQAIWNSPELQEYFGVTVPNYNFSAIITSAPEYNLYDTQKLIDKDGNAVVKGPAGYTASSIGAKYLYDDDLMKHLYFANYVDPSIFEGCYVCSTPSDTMTRESTLEFTNWLDEADVSFTFADYEDQGSGLMHVFNIGHPTFPESVQANNDMIAYMQSLIK